MIKFFSSHGYKEDSTICKSKNITWHINRAGNRNNTIISEYEEKAIDKIHHLFMIKIRRNTSQHRLHMTNIYLTL